MADILSSVGNALGLTDKGELTKLSILSYDDASRSGKSIQFDAYINPDEYSLNYNVMTDKTAINGKNANDQDVVLNIQPLEVSLKFFLDGTNITGKKIDVKTEIGNFYKVIGYNGNTHKPRYLTLMWGKGSWLREDQDSFNCFLKTATFQYKMFRPDGSPLRAIINATFSEVLSTAEANGVDKKKSPDLTHMRIVQEGDTLPAMSNEIYGDFSYYLEVAKANDLKDFRNLVPGQKLFFPPFDKSVKSINNA